MHFLTIYEFNVVLFKFLEHLISLKKTNWKLFSSFLDTEFELDILKHKRELY